MKTKKTKKEFDPLRIKVDVKPYQQRNLNPIGVKEKKMPEPTYSTNWMLDEVTETVENKNKLSKKKLINLLAFQKIQYGIKCLEQIYAQAEGKRPCEIRVSIKELRTELEEKLKRRYLSL